MPISVGHPGWLSQTTRLEVEITYTAESNNITRKGFCISAFINNHKYVNIYILLSMGEVKMAGYWPSSHFAFLLTELAWSIKNLLYGIPRLYLAWCFYFCNYHFLLQNVFLKLINFLFSLFSFSLRLSVFSFYSLISTEKSHKILLMLGKIFYKRKLSCKTGNPERVESLSLTHSSS